MTVSAQYSHARRRLPEAASHLFHIGQLVRMRHGAGFSAQSTEFYRITGTLPAKDRSPQYRIRNDDERHERVTTQDSLELVGTLPTDSSTTLIERTFGDGQGTKA